MKHFIMKKILSVVLAWDVKFVGEKLVLFIEILFTFIYLVLVEKKINELRD